MQRYMIQWMDYGIQSIQRGVAGTHSAPRAISTRARRAETQKNEQRTHADGGSMGPSALDREIGTTRSCVLGCQISHGLRSMPRQWQCREIAGPRVHRTPLGAGWDWPPSLAVAGCWQQLC